MPVTSRRKRKRTRNSNQEEENTSNPTGPSENSPRRTRSKSANSRDETSQKKRRTEVPPPPEKEPKIKKTSDGKVRDIFCWVCHKIGGETSCESCPRVYHTDCLKKLKNKCGKDVKCECDLRSVDGRNEELKWDSPFLKRMLQYVMDRAIKPDAKSKSSFALKTKFSRYFHAWLAESDKLCKIMDIAILLDNMNGDEPYLTSNQFYLDVKWLYHNCCIFYGTDHEFTDLAKKFESNIKLELTDLEVCGECYQTKVIDKHADSFARICAKPHEIIWAKLRGSPYWPAKCMDIRNGHAEVRFFGTHDRANILTKNCIKISKGHPFKKKIHKAQYNIAMSELSVYVSNYVSRYGRFDFADPNTPLDGSSPKKTLRNEQGQSNTLNSRPSTIVPESGQNDAAADDDNTNNTAESTEKKSSLSLCSVNIFNENERNENISESVSDNGFLFHSSFTTHEHSEPISEQNNSYEFLSSSSENFAMPQTSQNSAISSPSLDETSIQPTANLTVVGTDMEENSVNCSINAHSSTLNKESFPVITSTHSRVEIPKGSQLAEPNSVNSLPIIASTSSAAGDSIDFACRNVSSPNENNEMQVDEPGRSNPSLFITSLKEHMQNLVTENNLNALFDDEEPEDEIQVISEETKTHSIMQNPAMLKAVGEILLATKPNTKNLFMKLQCRFMLTFIAMYIEAYFGKVGNEELKMIYNVCTKCVKKNQILEKENLLLQKDIKRLKDVVKTLEEEKERRNILDCQRNILKEVIIQKASERIKRNDNDGIQLQKYQENEKRMAEEIENFRSKLKEAKEKLEIKDQELGFYRETQKELKAQLDKYNENFKNVKSVEVQTDPTISNSEKNPHSEFVSTEDLQSSPLEYSSNNTSDDETGSEEQESSYTRTYKKTKIVIRSETMSSILTNDELNVNVLPQTFEENGFMANLSTLMPSSYIAASAPPLLSMIAPTQGPIFLDSENSASFLEATMQETSSSNNQLDGSIKTYMKRKKKNT